MIGVREMSIDDYDQVVGLWLRCEGVGLDEDTDTRENTDAYLRRNAGLSFVAERDGMVVGAVLCGHDGRRGYLHHLAVDQSCRRQGLGSTLVQRCLSALRSQGINKCNIMVFGANTTGLAFWTRCGWFERSDITFMQQWTNGSA